jgi:hypothetical protein
VLNNDIYITDLQKHKRVTFDGSRTVFNGIPDWVYEGIYHISLNKLQLINMFMIRGSLGI